MSADQTQIMCYCRNCGGERSHIVVSTKEIRWSEIDVPVEGADTWSILECAGCHTVTFVHENWFSEDFEMTDNGPEPIVHKDLYPPSPQRKIPEWARNLILDLPTDENWISGLYSDIYAAVGLKAFGLAAMGTRAIVDGIVTAKAGNGGNFRKKLDRMYSRALITQQQVEIIDSAFDAGSAAAHRGYKPTQADIFILLDVMEALLHEVYIVPAERERQAKAAAALKSRTPKRFPGKA